MPEVLATLSEVDSAFEARGEAAAEHSDDEKKNGAQGGKLGQDNNSSSSRPQSPSGNSVGGSKNTNNHAPAEELRRVEQLQQDETNNGGLKAGSAYYLVNRKWYLEWLQWVGHQSVQSPKIGPAAPRDFGGDLGLDDMGGDEFVAVVKENGGHESHEKPTTSTEAAPSSPALKALRRSWTKDRPGPVDNQTLLEENSQGVACLKRGLVEPQDYEIICEEVWTLLIGWYSGGPAIKRRAIQLPSGGVQVELFGLELKVYKSSDLSALPIRVTESKSTTVGSFKKRMCEETGLTVEKVRMWDYFNHKKYDNLENKDSKTLEACRIMDQNAILLEEANEDGTFPPEETKNENANDDLYSGLYNSSSGGYGRSNGGDRDHSSQDIPTQGRPPQRGAAGLQNLGNTCFMNSSIQCLSNIPSLREFFLTEAFRENLNPTAYKTKGQLAESFAQLLKMIWKEDTVKVAPRNFKWQVGQFAEQFSGYGQQDSMELIEYVLDGLKEDCNKVQGTKPYVEIKEAEGRPDTIVAEEARLSYSLRNNSALDQIFVGFFKSTVTCPEESCQKQSVTFDPFLSVQLHLVSSAVDKTQSIAVTVVPRASSGKPAAKRTVSVNKSGTVRDLIEAVSKEAGIQAKDCILVELWSKKAHKFFEETDSVETIRADDVLLVYEFEEAESFRVTTEQRWGGSSSSAYSPGLGQGYSLSSVAEDAGLENNGSQNRPDEPATQQAQEECYSGVVVHHRQVRSSSFSIYSSKELVGLPTVFCVLRKSSVRELVDAVSKELVDRYGPDGGQGWKLYRINDKWSVTSPGTLLDPSASTDDGMMLSSGANAALNQREYLAVEWEEGVTIPAPLTRALSEAEESVGRGGNGSSQAEQELPLEKCFSMFTETEKLSEEDLWYCSKCKEHREAFKRIQLWSLPAVLVVQLKRFSYTRWTRERLDTPVHFPLEGLDLAPYCLPADCKDASSSSRTAEGSPDGGPQGGAGDEGAESSIYDLVAVSKHIGALGGGHYVAYARSSIDGVWYLFDDGWVRAVTTEEVRNDRVGAYVLFYIRRDHRPDSWGTPAE